jgi:hypothetical protein
MRVRIELREERTAGNAAPDRAAYERTVDVNV